MHGKVRDGVQNATIAVQRSGRTNASRRIAAREGIELGVNERSGGDRFLHGIQQKVGQVHRCGGLGLGCHGQSERVAERNV